MSVIETEEERADLYKPIGEAVNVHHLTVKSRSKGLPELSLVLRFVADAIEHGMKDGKGDGFDYDYEFKVEKMVRLADPRPSHMLKPTEAADTPFLVRPQNDEEFVRFDNYADIIFDGHHMALRGSIKLAFGDSTLPPPSCWLEVALLAEELPAFRDALLWSLEMRRESKRELQAAIRIHEVLTECLFRFEGITVDGETIFRSIGLYDHEQFNRWYERRKAESK